MQVCACVVNWRERQMRVSLSLNRTQRQTNMTSRTKLRSPHWELHTGRRFADMETQRTAGLWLTCLVKPEQKLSSSLTQNREQQTETERARLNITGGFFFVRWTVNIKGPEVQMIPRSNRQSENQGARTATSNPEQVNIQVSWKTGRLHWINGQCFPHNRPLFH